MYLNLLFLLPLLVAAEPLPKPVCGGELPWQLVRDPSFELPAPKTGINEGRWTVNVTALPPSASGPSPQYDTSGSLAQSGVGAFTFPGSTQSGVGYDAVVTISQTLTLCTSAQYSFSAWVGYWDDFDPAVFGTSITVYLDDVVIVPTQLTCSDFGACTTPAVKSGLKVGYREIQTIITPTATTGTLKFVFTLNAAAAGNSALYATVLDDITLKKVMQPTNELLS